MSQSLGVYCNMSPNYSNVHCSHSVSFVHFLTAAELSEAVADITQVLSSARPEQVLGSQRTSVTTRVESSRSCCRHRTSRSRATWEDDRSSLVHTMHRRPTLFSCAELSSKRATHSVSLVATRAMEAMSLESMTKMSRVSEAI